MDTHSSRRALLKKAAIGAGVVAWSQPVIQSVLAAPAAAQSVPMETEIAFPAQNCTANRAGAATSEGITVTLSGGKLGGGPGISWSLDATSIGAGCEVTQIFAVGGAALNVHSAPLPATTGTSSWSACPGGSATYGLEFTVSCP